MRQPQVGIGELQDVAVGVDPGVGDNGSRAVDEVAHRAPLIRNVPIYRAGRAAVLGQNRSTVRPVQINDRGRRRGPARRTVRIDELHQDRGAVVSEIPDGRRNRRRLGVDRLRHPAIEPVVSVRHRVDHVVGKILGDDPGQAVAVIPRIGVDPMRIVIDALGEVALAVVRVDGLPVAGDLVVGADRVAVDAL